jgi:hypothetical protein|tara:strand:- start:96 stop:917 length:822 start_codon:yes stop_codon:yes gene_type:complete
MNLVKEFKRLFSFRQGRVNRRKEVRQQLRIRKNLERSLFRKLTSLFRKAIRVRSFLYEETGIFEKDILVGSINEELMPVMLQHFKRVFKTIYDFHEAKYKTLIKEEALVFDRNVDIDNLANEFFKQRELFLVGVSTRLANRVDKIIREGREANLTLREIAKEIDKIVLPIVRSRGALIARTETHNAASFANHKYHEKVRDDYDIPMVKVWSSVNDSRTRSNHAAANGQRVGMDEDFLVGGLPMGYAGDPRGGAKNVINCRCVILYADENDIVQ